MRIIGGLLRGKNITPPINYKARPTTDFAKEGLFNTLANEVDFSQISVLDLFAGTGSISYEFASRGCEDIIAVEMNPANFAFIKKTAAALGLKTLQVVHHNVFDFIEICTRQFDMIFADPPYGIDGLGTIPDKIFAKQLVKKEGYLILEHPSTYSFTDHTYFVKEKKYGNVHFSYFKNK
ncbi:MAG: RsmD family RNA methyltransferase [Bacteroidales bacterium]|nr:RsmD family RNA methyltransferase [Bacteroidales bacterium]MDD4670227.1 RsmD family RNA methyltransferase [Bacteroidales bacterium]